MSKELTRKERALAHSTPEWRRELSQMMVQWHFSIQHIEQFIIKTIEEETAKRK